MSTGFIHVVACIRIYFPFQAENFPLYVCTFTYDPGTLLPAASVLGLGASEFLHANFKSKFIISYSTPGLPDVSPAGFQSQTYGGSPSQWRSPSWGA